MAEYINREDALDAVLFALVGTGLQSAAIYAIREVPTADVVPKDIFGLWKELAEKSAEENETLKDNNEHLAVMLKEAKAEVAREIFEEIDKILKTQERYLYCNPSLTYVYELIEELKKKYTAFTHLYSIPCA